MIYTGIDMIEIDRIEKVLNEYNERFLNKIFTKNEQIYCNKRPKQLASRFAAKEALSKALGFGLYRNSVYPSSIVIKHDDFGKPFFVFLNQLEKFLKTNTLNIHLSITDSDTQSVAFVTIDQ